MEMFAGGNNHNVVAKEMCFALVLYTFWCTPNCDEGFVISFYVTLSKIGNLINCMGLTGCCLSFSYPRELQHN